MDRRALAQLLGALKASEMSVEEAMERLSDLPFEDVGFAKIDHHRALRSGMPEVIFAAGKQPHQVAEIFARLASNGVDVLATRADEAAYAAVAERVPMAKHYAEARCIALAQTDRE